MFGIMLNILMLRFVQTLGMRNKDEVRRWGATSKPSLGGITFYLCFLLSFLAYSFITPQAHLFLNIKVLGLLFASTVGFMLGLFDDAYNTKPLVKLISQILAAAILIFSGVYIKIFDIEILNYLVTILWVVGIMNSINMLDNMDAVSTIVAISVFLTVLLKIIYIGDWNNIDIVLLLGILAALIGFLFFNWNPSKMFMGDTGSQFIGVLLAAYGISYFINADVTSTNNSYSEWKNLISLSLAFLLPFTDTITVFYKRIAAGKSPFVGGKDHTTHHLSYVGLKDRQVALLFIFISLISIAMNFYLMNFVTKLSFVLVLVILLVIFAVFITLFVIANKNKNKSV
jgi:UDP-GlcNAc:undecaprenyl-phosphate/decaprenyl-phosphate GlcNAc-1-phosphate transferase